MSKNGEHKYTVDELRKMLAAAESSTSTSETSAQEIADNAAAKQDDKKHEPEKDNAEPKDEKDATQSKPDTPLPSNKPITDDKSNTARATAAPKDGTQSSAAHGLAESAKQETKSFSTVDGNIISQINSRNVHIKKTSTPLLDVKQIDIIQDFKIVNEITGYITYYPGHNRVGISETRLIENNTLSAISEDTHKIFQTGLVNMQYGLNPEFFGKEGEMIDMSVILNKDGITDVGYTTTPNMRANYINGLIQFITAVTCDNRIYQMKSGTLRKMAEKPPLIEDMISDRLLLPFGAHLALAARSGDVVWLRNLFDNMLQTTDVKYHLGYVEGVEDSITGVRSHFYSDVNLDHLVCEIVNRNGQALLTSRNGVEQITNAIKAYCPMIASVNVAEIETLTLITNVDYSKVLSALTLGCIMSATCREAILSANVEYYKLMNVFVNRQRPDLVPITLQSSAGASVLVNLLNGRLNSVDYPYINHALASESFVAMTPGLLMCGPKPTTLEGAFIGLIEYFAYNIMFPNQFELVKGSIGNQILDCLKVINKNDVSEFLSVYGYKYSLDARGGQIPLLDQREWNNQVDYLGNFYPSVFGETRQIHNRNIVVKTMKWFKPIGETVVDEGAMNAEFPRLSNNPTHYIPYVHSRSANTTDFSNAFSKFVTFLMTLVNDVTRGGKTKSSQSIQSIQDWMLYVVRKAEDLDTTMHSYLSVLMRTRANSVLNFTSEFKGIYKGYKPLNYALLSNNEIFGRLQSIDMKYRDQCARCNTGVVWQILCNSTSRFMDRAGNNATGIKANLSAELIPMPDIGPLLLSDMNIAEYISRVALSVGLVSGLFSSRVLPDNEDKEKFLGLLQSLNMPNSTFAELLEVTSKRVGAEMGQFGRVFLPNGLSSQRAKLLNPTFRRIKYDNSIPEQFDPAIDPPIFADVQLFMKDIELERFKVALKGAVNLPLLKLQKGVRLMMQQVVSPYPDYLPNIPDGYIECEYSQEMFKQSRNGNVAVYTLHIDNVNYGTRDTWPKVHMKIPQRTIIHKSVREYIEIAITQKSWIVDLLDVQYIPVITPTRVESLETMRTILARDVNILEKLSFCDESLSVPHPGVQLPNSSSYAQFVFPMTRVTGRYVLSAYGNVDYSDDLPPNVIPPRLTDFDTGKLIDQTVPTYNIQAYDGIPKSSLPFISMSNTILTYSGNLDYTKKLTYEYLPYDSLFDFASDDVIHAATE